MTGAVADRVRKAIPTISVGMLTADMMVLGRELDAIAHAGAQMVHFDVMDGCFCPMLTIGAPVIKGIRTTMLKDVHLMISEPLEKLQAFVAAGADMITVHAESTVDPLRVLQALGTMENSNDSARGIMRGIALNPGTPLSVVEPLLDDLEIVFLLAVNPGWGGQKFIPGTSARFEQLQKMIEGSGRSILTGLDGGVTRNNIGEISKLGADIVVTGSAVFDGPESAKNARFMLHELRQGREQ